MKLTVKYFLFFLIFALIPFFFAHKAAADIVMQVKDGNTVLISPSTGGAFYTCKLFGIDAPEAGQPYGQEAIKELKHLVLLQTVEVTFKNTKSYTREICQIRLNGMDVGLDMIRHGYAWANKGTNSGKYAEAEKHAREKKLGLWKDKNPEPPWEFRKKK